jgi:23S rRNA pseudouridine2457 synthase
MAKTYVLYKPYGMLSQFTQEVEGQTTLADLDFVFEKDVYPVGRLDSDSEGLLLLSNNKALNQALLNPSRKHPRTYWAQVEGMATPDQIAQLQHGVDIQINGKKHRTAPAKVMGPIEAPTLPERNPPIRVRKTVPDCWIQLELTEGKNRQVRRMCAAVGLPVLRLVRAAMAGLELGDMQPGDVRIVADPKV